MPTDLFTIFSPFLYDLWMKNIDQTPEERSLLYQTLSSYIHQYKDVVHTHRTHGNAKDIRDAYCLHALNHTFK